MCLLRNMYIPHAHVPNGSLSVWQRQAGGDVVMTQRMPSLQARSPHVKQRAMPNVVTTLTLVSQPIHYFIKNKDLLVQSSLSYACSITSSIHCPFNFTGDILTRHKRKITLVTNSPVKGPMAVWQRATQEWLHPWFILLFARILSTLSHQKYSVKRLIKGIRFH